MHGDNSKAVSLSLLSMQMEIYQNKSGKESANLLHFCYSLLLLYVLQSQMMTVSQSLHSVPQQYGVHSPLDNRKATKDFPKEQK